MKPPALAAVVFAATLAGCPPPEPSLLPSPAVRFDDDTVTTYAVDGGFGDVTGRATVRALNGFGAAIPAPDLPLRTDGEQSLVRFDATGFAVVRFDTPGEHTVEADGAVGEVHVAPDAYTPPLLPLASPPGVTGAIEAAAVGQGLVVRTQDAVWWAGRGELPMRVFVSPEPLVGLRTGDIDVDGATDAVVWTTAEVFLLRGRPGGGMAWGAGFRATGYQVGGVDLGDLSGDNLTDVVIGWVGGETGGVLDVWEGDGQWSFFASYARALAAEPTGVAVNDATNDSVDQVTVSTTLGSWSRYVLLEHQLVPVGPLVPDGTLALEATVVPWGDATGDGGEELSFRVVDPATGRIQQMTLFNLLGTEPLFDPTRYTWDSTGARWDAGDADADGYTELFYVEEALRLGVVAWSSTEGFVTRVAGDLPEFAPFALRDFDADDILDLALAGDEVWRFYDADDRTSGVEGLPWGLDRTRWNVVTNFGGGPTLVLPSPADRVRVLTFERTNGGETHARVLDWFGEDLPVEIEERSSLDISDTGADVREVVRCGSDVYVLLDGLLRRLTYTEADGSLALGAVRTDTVGQGITCGAGPQGAVLGLAEGDELILFNRSIVRVGEIVMTGANDVAFSDLGAGPVAQGCNTAGCSIIGFQNGFFETSPAGSFWHDASGSAPIAGAFTWTALDDVDGDGSLEVVAATPGGLVGVYRGTGTSLAGPRIYHHTLAAHGMPAFADGDHDGLRDLWLATDDRSLEFTLSAPEPVDTTAPTTGTPPTDTGTPPTPTTP